MKIKQIIILTIIFFAIVVNANTNLRFITESYPPLGYEENGIKTGAGVEIVNEIKKRLNINKNIEIYPWVRAYKMGLNKQNIVLFCTALSDERKDKFKWVGPIINLELNIYGDAQSNIKINSLEDAKKLKKIGVYKESVFEQMLKKEKFTNLEAVLDNMHNIKKLKLGRFSAFTADNLTVGLLAKKAGYSLGELKKLYTMQTIQLFIAFSKDISDDIVLKWQQTLDNMKKDGTFKKIYKKWFPNEIPPIETYEETIDVVTEDLKPYSYIANNEITGLSTKIVKETLSLAKIKSNIKIYPWARSYSMATSQKNVLIYSIIRIPQREDKFKWVGTIAPYTVSFYKLKARKDIKINSLNDAKKYRISSLKLDVRIQYLQSQGFKVSTVYNDKDSFKDLIENKVDIIPYSDASFYEKVEQYGYNKKDFEKVYLIKGLTKKLYMAFGAKTDDIIVNKVRSALKIIKSKQSYKDLLNKYGF